MPRPIEFDPDQALANAMLLFWRRGYHKASVREITETTHLQPGSLYGAFRNKRTLFLRALDRYSDEIRRFVDATLYGEGPPLVRIRRFFDRLLQDSTCDPEAKGCLLVNTLLETPAEDEEIIRAAARALEEVELAFRRALEEAAARGELAAGRDPEALARLLMTGIYGLRVYYKVRPQREVLEGIVVSLLAALHIVPKHDGSGRLARHRR